MLKRIIDEIITEALNTYNRHLYIFVSNNQEFDTCWNILTDKLARLIRRQFGKQKYNRYAQLDLSNRIRIRIIGDKGHNIDYITCGAQIDKVWSTYLLPQKHAIIIRAHMMENK